MEDKHTVVSSFKPLGAAGAVEDGIERSFFAVYDGMGLTCHHAVPKFSSTCRIKALPRVFA